VYGKVVDKTEESNCQVAKEVHIEIEHGDVHGFIGSLVVGTHFGEQDDGNVESTEVAFD
jgi:hypothetical protein